MTNPPTIEIPRLEHETPPRYAARVEYLTMGESRDLRSLAQKLHKSLTLVGRWSTIDNWQEHARRYDEALAGLAVQQHAASYLADLEEHRTRYQKTGRALHGVAGRMLEQLSRQVATMELNAASLATITKAMQVAADLEAHALRVGELLPKLSNDVLD